MNKRIFDKTTKAELFLGKPLKIKYVNPYGNKVSVSSNNLTSELLNWLIAEKAVDIVDTPNHSISTDISFYINKVGSKFGLNEEQSLDFINDLSAYSPVLAFSLLAKQIAFELDKKYTDHIKNSDKIYCISNINGAIVEIPKTSIRSYKNFAAFRNPEDAKFARRLCKDIFKLMFSDEQK